MDKEVQHYKKMTETPVAELVLRLAVPTTVSMLITSLYSTADTYFVSKISVSASGATGIVFALMALLQAFGFMCGHGSGSNISRFLGAKQNERATVFASTGFFMALLIGVILGVLGRIFIDPLMYLFGSTETILPYARIYATYILIGAPALVASCVLNNILRYEGRAMYSMIGLTSGGILNVILDPILIFGCNMGIHGAGLSTAFSQYVSLVILLIPFLRGKTSSQLSVRSVTRDMADIGNILATGTPNLIRQGLSSVSTSILNGLAAPYGDAAIASFSIVSKCANIVFSLAIGLAQGFQPVAAFNYGAKKYGRVRKAVIFTMVTSVSILIVLGGICYLNAEKVIALFRDEPLILEIGSDALRYMCIGILFLPISGAGSMLFQSTGNKGKALLAALLQSGGLYIPLMYILSSLFGLTGLEWSHPASYIMAFTITLPMVIAFTRKLKKADQEGLTL